MVDLFWEFFLNYMFMLMIMFYVTKRDQDPIRLMTYSFFYTAFLIGMFHLVMHLSGYDEKSGNKINDLISEKVNNYKNSSNLKGLQSNGSIDINSLNIKDIQNIKNSDNTTNVSKLKEYTDKLNNKDKKKVYKKDKYGFTKEMSKENFN